VSATDEPATTLTALAVDALQAREPQRAQELARRALAADARSPWAHNIMGNALSQLGQHEQAIASFASALALAPDYADAYYNRGNALLDLHHYDGAIADYDRAIALRPAFASAHSNRAMALAGCGRLEAALDSFDCAIAANGADAEAHYGRGRVLHELRRLQDAASSYSRAIELNPQHAPAHVNRAMALLACGDYENGWSDFEWRWKSAGSILAAEARELQRPLWCGDAPLAGQTILLHGEQGLGDALQFCRYATLVADLGARVILEVPAPLVELLAPLPGVAQVLARGEPLPQFDLHCPLMSLPRAFGTTVQSIPGPVSYLRAPAGNVAQWRARLAHSPRLRVGLAWSGSPGNQYEHHRRIPLAQLAQALPRDCEYFCLQTELQPADQPALAACLGMIRHVDDLGICSTAALCECLDLIISVDTSIAHLSAALGRPTWILLPFNSDWRWLQERDDSPWYPTARLYRQRRAGDWPEVLARVAADLARPAAAARGAVLRTPG
jgi:Tfp pilus assembly protein PilF